MTPQLREQILQAEELMNEGEVEQALELLQNLSVLYPDNYHIASLIGECHLSLGEPDKAIKPLKWATKTFPDKEVEELDENFESAEDVTVSKLREVITEAQGTYLWVDHYLLGCAYGRTMNFRNAIKHLNLANRLNPENAEIIRNIGWIRCMQEKKETGRKLLRKAISLDPTNALAYNDLGASFMFEEEFDEAEKWIDKARQIDPDDDFIIRTADKLEELRAYKTLFKKAL